MTYATRQDLVARFGAQEVADLLDTPRDAHDPRADAPAADTPADSRLAAALGDAAAEIDAALAPRYALPLPDGPWPRLAGLACDLARRRLYDDRPSEIVTERARSARAALKRLAAGPDKGGEALLDAAGNPAPARGAGHAMTDGPEPAMTRDKLAGL